ncbi:MAG TPA: MmpS family transport accessory protein [Mycobacterium sp.]|nr:MmpS family transport accessory protein [Mycobacterium sp.]
MINEPFNETKPGGTRRTVMSALSGVLVGSAVIWGAPVGGATPSVDPDWAKVRYELSGTGVAGYVTYQTDRGQLHATGAPLPWSMEVTRRSEGSIMTADNSLSAQTAGPGSLTCVIKVDGKVVAQNSATGEPARVLCQSHDGRSPESAHPPVLPPTGQ